MLRHMLRSKIMGLRITRTELYYEGSITLDEDLLAAADILPGERVMVLNLNNGARIETYTIKGERGSGEAILNGPAARTGQVGDAVIVLSFSYVEDAAALNGHPRVVHVGDNNRLPKD